jgi:hypothetical protein
MAQLTFGTGRLVLTPSGANVTPIQVGVLQKVTLDISQDTIELYGDKQFAVDVALGKAKITGKITTGTIYSKLFQAALTGTALTAGHQFGVIDQTTGVISGAAYDTGFVKANFIEDLGVYDENGAPMTVVASAPAAGQYLVSTSGSNAVYTFNAGATGKTYSVSYVKYDSTTGITAQVNNAIMGANPAYYQLGLWNPGSRSKDNGLRLPRVVIPKLSIPYQNDNFAISDLDFTAFASPTPPYPVATSYTIE